MSEGNANSGLHRFDQGGFQPYAPPTYTPRTFAAPTLSPFRGYSSPIAPAVGGLLGGETYGGGEGMAPATTPGGMPSGLAGLAALGISAVTGVPAGLIGLGLNAASSSANAGGAAVGSGVSDSADGTAGVGVGNGGIGSPGAGTAAGDAAGNTEGSGGPAGGDAGDSGGGGGGGSK